MPKPKKAGGRVVRMSPLTIARIEAELITLAVELKARDPDMTPAALQALKKRLRRAMVARRRHGSLRRVRVGVVARYRYDLHTLRSLRWEHGRERVQGGGHPADDRHEQRCETTRRVSQVKWSVSLPPRHRGAVWAEGDEMIAATYARKSNKQQGVADEPRVEVA
jgi:hypothetical protein